MQLLFFIEIVVSAKNQLVERRSREWKAEGGKAGKGLRRNKEENQEASYTNIKSL